VKRLLLCAAALLSGTVFADTIAITGGTVAIGDGSQPIPNGVVVIRDGRVAAAGANVAVPAGARVVDATGKWVVAGIVAGATSEGIVDGEGIDETYDGAAGKSVFNAAIDVSTAINPTNQSIAVDRTWGVTRAFVFPEANNSVFAGQGAVIDTGADDAPVTRARAFQYAELGEDGASHIGSRPASYVMLHDALAAAKSRGGDSKDALITRADAAALVPVIEGRMPLIVHVERASDILQVLTLKQTYPNLKLILLGVSEGWIVAPKIAAAHVPVIAAALADLPEAFERVAATESNVARMEKAGVTVAISTVDVATEAGQRNLRQYAGNLVGIGRVPGMAGLDWGAAFATVTSRPAAVLGIDGEIGSLRPGRRADVVIWDGDPLELSSAPVAVWIDGVAQPMTSRQTKLRDRYLNPQEGALPKAYER
jgi:imidazolonepropionase-like amidohydrolase